MSVARMMSAEERTLEGIAVAVPTRFAANAAAMMCAGE